MPVLPNTPFTALTSERTDVDSPVSEDLMQDIGIDLNYLKSILSDGAAAVAGIVASTYTGTGAFANTGSFTETGNSQFNGDVNVTGTFSTGVFFSSEQILWLYGL